MKRSEMIRFIANCLESYKSDDNHHAEDYAENIVLHFIECECDLEHDLDVAYNWEDE